VRDEREYDRDLYWILGFLAIAIALMYVFDIPYREGWMYWVGIPAMTVAVMAALAGALWLFRRWRSG
jgi:predicted lysophospholipase L1 biosynthesis ABC-type transport system permease subunit